MAKETKKVSAVKKTIKNVTKAVKEVIAELSLCVDCNGKGLKDSNTLCPLCAGRGKI